MLVQERTVGCREDTGVDKLEKGLFFRSLFPSGNTTECRAEDVYTHPYPSLISPVNVSSIENKEKKKI